MTISWALMVPVFIVLGIVLPLWITFHYITVWLRMRAERHRPNVTEIELERLRENAATLESRVRALESILDSESPDWRNK